MGKPKPPTPPDPKETAAAQTGTNVTTALANTLLGNVNQVTPDGTLTYSYSGFGGQPQPSAPPAAAMPDPLAQTAPPQVDRRPRGDPRNDDVYSYSAPPQVPARPAQAQPADPAGGVTNADDGGFWITDPTSGASYTIPQITATVELSPEQRAIKEQTDAAELGLATIANDATGRLGGILNTPFNYDGIQPGGDLSRLQPANYQQYGAGPELQTSVGPAGVGFDRKVAGAGQGFQYSIPGAGQGIQRGLGITPGQGIQASIDPVDAQRIYGLDLSGMPNYATSASGGRITRDYGPEDGFSEDRRRVEEALFSRLEPQFDTDQEALRSQLINQGISLGSEAYGEGMDQFTRQMNDARYGAVLAGGQEQSRLMDMERQRAQFQNAAQQQAYAQSYQNALLKNQAANAELAKQLAAAGFTNQAINDEFGQRLASGQFQNAARGQEFGEHLASGNFANSAQAQQIQQLLASANLNNTARDSAFGQRAFNANLNNAAVDAAFNQRLAAGNFANVNNQQMYDNQFRATTGNNMLGDQAFRREQSIFDATNLTRDREIAERTNLRNQPINEIAALLSGAQVAQPQFINTQSAQIPTVDFAGLTQNNYAQQLGAWQNSNSAWNNAFGNIADAAGTLGGAWIMSDRRVKADIRPLGGGWYSYRYKHDAPGALRAGVMAQEAPASAVREIGGVLHVNYDMLEAA